MRLAYVPLYSCFYLLTPSLSTVTINPSNISEVGSSWEWLDVLVIALG